MQGSQTTRIPHRKTQKIVSFPHGFHAPVCFSTLLAGSIRPWRRGCVSIPGWRLVSCLIPAHRPGWAASQPDPGCVVASMVVGRCVPGSVRGRRMEASLVSSKCLAASPVIEKGSRHQIYFLDGTLNIAPIVQTLYRY